MSELSEGGTWSEYEEEENAGGSKSQPAVPPLNPIIPFTGPIATWTEIIPNVTQGFIPVGYYELPPANPVSPWSFIRQDQNGPFTFQFRTNWFWNTNDVYHMRLAYVFWGTPSNFLPEWSSTITKSGTGDSTDLRVGLAGSEIPTLPSLATTATTPYNSTRNTANSQEMFACALSIGTPVSAPVTNDAYAFSTVSYAVPTGYRWTVHQATVSLPARVLTDTIEPSSSYPGNIYKKTRTISFLPTRFEQTAAANALCPPFFILFRGRMGFKIDGAVSPTSIEATSTGAGATYSSFLIYQKKKPEYVSFSEEGIATIQIEYDLRSFQLYGLALLDLV
jgi:hypothetical protein